MKDEKKLLIMIVSALVFAASRINRQHSESGTLANEAIDDATTLVNAWERDCLIPKDVLDVLP